MIAQCTAKLGILWNDLCAYGGIISGRYPVPRFFYFEFDLEGQMLNSVPETTRYPVGTTLR